MRGKGSATPAAVVAVTAAHAPTVARASPSVASKVQAQTAFGMYRYGDVGYWDCQCGPAGGQGPITTLQCGSEQR